MGQVTGFGGAFFRSNKPEALYVWYEKHLGLRRVDGSFQFPSAGQRAQAVLAFFPTQSDYFPPGQAAMLNLQVDDLHGLLDRLQQDGVAVDSRRDSYDFGEFGWVTDLDGNRVELWQPKDEV